MPRKNSPPRERLRAAITCALLLFSTNWALAVDPKPPASETATDAPAASTAPVDKDAGIRPRHWRIAWTKDPATCAMVAWNTRNEGTSHQLRLRKKGETDFQNVTPTNGQFSYGEKVEPDLDLFYHRAEISELQPGTTYEVQFVSDSVESRVFHFVTAPGGESPFSLLFGGDSRSDRKSRVAINRFVAKTVADSESADPADRICGVLHAGDYAVRGTSLPLWVGWMSDHESMVTESGRLIPMVPARGNHDLGRLFNECFGFETRDEHNWYGVSFGSMLRVVTLNTETSIAGDQKAWLREELKHSIPSHRWVVPQYHRPGYAAVKVPGGALAHWVPIFEEFNIKLVCEGDGHVIKRTLPIRGGKPDDTGVVYIGEGGFGVPQRTPKEKRWFLKPPGMCSSGHHVQRLKFMADRLCYECLLPDENGGKVVDSWEVAR